MTSMGQLVHLGITHTWLKYQEAVATNSTWSRLRKQGNWRKYWRTMSNSLLFHGDWMVMSLWIVIQTILLLLLKNLIPITPALYSRPSLETMLHYFRTANPFGWRMVLVLDLPWYICSRLWTPSSLEQLFIQFISQMTFFLFKLILRMRKARPLALSLTTSRKSQLINQIMCCF